METTIPINPIGIPTTATVSFIESYVPSGGAILEIGCGSGHVVAELSMRGYEVVGIDSDKEAVSQARRLDVRIFNASWPKFDIDKVDAVIFTRSLHHISPLPKAVAKALEVLKPGGTVLIEDFAFDEADPAAIKWFLKVVRSQKGQALITPTPNEFVTTLLNASDALNAWHQDHDHELHTAAEMTLAIGRILLFVILSALHISIVIWLMFFRRLLRQHRLSRKSFRRNRASEKLERFPSLAIA